MSGFKENIVPVMYEEASASFNNTAVVKLTDLFTEEFFRNANYWMLTWTQSDSAPVVVRYSKAGPMTAGQGAVAVVRRMPSSTLFYGYLLIENPCIFDKTYLRGDTNRPIVLQGQAFNIQADAKLSIT